jgi:hypothetical protein
MLPAMLPGDPACDKNACPSKSTLAETMQALQTALNSLAQEHTHIKSILDQQAEAIRSFGNEGRNPDPKDQQAEDFSSFGKEGRNLDPKEPPQVHGSPPMLDLPSSAWAGEESSDAVLSGPVPGPKFTLGGSGESDVPVNSVQSIPDLSQEIISRAAHAMNAFSVTRRNKDHAAQQSSVFFNADKAMEQAKEEVLRHCKDDVDDYYHSGGIAQAIAKSSFFEVFTFMLILVNAIWLAIEVSLNNEELLVNADIEFQIVEHLFCFFFFFEWLIRFAALRKKVTAIKDTWFLFDSGIVLAMVLETWILSVVCLAVGDNVSTGSGTSILRVVKLVRLTRVCRIGRLFRAFPEIMLIFKSVAVVMKTVLMISFVLVTTTYVFAIIMTQLCKGSKFQDDLFQNVPTAMFSLILGAVFPDMAELTHDLAGANPVYAIVFLAFTVFVTLIIMNMLIGALVDVVHGVSSLERETNEVTTIQDALEQLLSKADVDNSEGISRCEFDHIMSDPAAAKTLSKAGVDVHGLMEMVDIVFHGQKEMSNRDMMEWFLQLRSGNPTKVKDITDLRRYLHTDLQELKACLQMQSGHATKGTTVQSETATPQNASCVD